MLIEFFLKLKEGGVPVSIREFLTLIEALHKEVAFGNVEDFYYLARTCLVKDEKYFDRYDRVFAAYFKGIIEVDELTVEIPEEWLKKLAEKHLTEEEKQLIESLGFPFLALNVRDTEWDELVFERYRMFEQGGVKIAVLGQAFPYTPIANPRWMIPKWSFGIREEDVRAR